MRSNGVVQSYGHSFILKDNSGNIYSDTPYIMIYDETTVEGISDKGGCTEKVYITDESDVEIKIDWDKVYQGK
ncbi:hypothetical protein HYE59_09210 [Aggregatibacter actinomycetemcomitans]|uniref:hypothetical protein n=1 Tax=Aggregatibacter actinomycetemcomitans TaxID=714 RepID=UPI00197B966A|nr:hypothetical protein [Aggregatibacter actinomycetemcomitans]MBN6077704.1 hypothetical protein [Aggregatibacter actinomycetemcomitans]